MGERSSIAERFYRLFAGLERAHGQYAVKLVIKDGKEKQEGSANTHLTPATVALWESHLAGSYRLGIIPIRDDGTCRFGAIDIDVYVGLEHKTLAAAVARMRLPLIVCRSKSGGAHLYLFCKEDVPAELLRGKLMEWAVALGYSGVEVFPKQTRLASEKDVGNWINMPYQAADKHTMCYAQLPDKALKAEEFLDYAEGLSISVAELEAVELPPDETIDTLLLGAPPCLQALARNGFPAGTRNNALFNLAVYLRKRYPDSWADYLEAMNQKFMNPPLSREEVTQIVKSVRKKAYSYRCKDHPIVSVCNRQICLTREFGIGDSSDDPGVMFGDIVKLATQPPTWIWDVNGARIELSTEELMDQRSFQKRAIDELDKWPNLVKPGVWHKIVQERLDRVTHIEVPIDATAEGQWWVYMERFCTGRAQGRSMDELLLGKPFTERGRTYFCSSDLLEYLHKQRVSGVTEKKLFTFLRKHQAKHHFYNLKGKGLNCWSVPQFQAQTEEHDVPRISKEGEF